MRRSLAAAIVLFVLCAGGASAARSVGYYGCRTFVAKHPTAVVKPTSIVVACGDGNLYLTGIHWATWNASTATGSGMVHSNDCKPYCAADHFHTAPATVTLSKPRSCKGNVVFTNLRLRSKSISAGDGYACVP
jgi:hypothetical protein